MSKKKIVLTEADIFIAATAAMQESDPWKQVIVMRDLLIARLNEEREK